MYVQDTFISIYVVLCLLLWKKKKKRKEKQYPAGQAILGSSSKKQAVECNFLGSAFGSATLCVCVTLGNLLYRSGTQFPQMHIGLSVS